MKEFKQSKNVEYNFLGDDKSMGQRTELEKTLSPASVCAIAVGSILGFGCFILPSDFLQDAGPLGASIGILLGAISMMLIAKSYGYMVTAFPVAGGEFVYSYKGFGSKHAYLCGWFLTLGYLSIIPLNATALGVLARSVAPGVFSQGHLYDVAGFEVYIGEILLTTLAIIGFGIFNYRGLKSVGKLQTMMVMLLLSSVLVIGLGTLISPNASVQNLQPLFPPDKSAFGSIITLFALAPWLYVGFSTIPQAAEEYAFSPTQAFKLIVSALFFGGLTYVIVLLATGMVFPWMELVNANYAWATGTAMQVSIGKFGMWFLTLAVCMGIFTGINGFYMATSRLLYSMARAKILPAWFGKIHPKYGTPSNAILFIMVISLTAPWFGRQVISWVVDMASMGITIGYLYTCLAAYGMVRGLSKAELRQAHFGKGYAVVGAMLSVLFIAILCIPGSPGAMAPPSWVALIIWAIIGMGFYIRQSKVFTAVPKGMMDYLVLNIKDNLTEEELSVLNSNEGIIFGENTLGEENTVRA